MSTGNGILLESDKYHVIRELGRGGMGVVYLAEDRQLRRRVALKVLYDYLNRDQAFVERFQEEACSVSTLHHPNIVCVHGLDRSGEVVAIDMEFVDGVSLDQVTVVTPHIAAAIARDVLGGLAACHQIGVVHRDIKPSNILVSQAGQAKITDFGLATAYASHMEATLGGSTSSGFYMGTPRYMPIQAWEGSAPEPCWDLYSFGVVLHELLSGRTAFQGENPIAVMRKQLTESLPPLHNSSGPISVEFSGLVETLLNTCKEGAVLTCAEALDLLRNTPEFKVLQEGDASPTLPALPRLRRKSKYIQKLTRLKLAVAASAVLLPVLAGGLVAMLRPESPSGGRDVSSESPPPAPDITTAVPVSGSAFYDAEVLNGSAQDEAVWMVETDERAQPRRILGVSKLAFWSMEVESVIPGARPRVTGSWAARLSEAGTAINRGTLEGTLQWGSGRNAVLSLVRIRENDRQRTPLTLTCSRKAVEYGRIEFFREIERNPVLTSLLYRELLPRGFPWATAIEAALPALPGARVSVPCIDDTIVIDGNLDESTWKNGAFDDAAGLIGELMSRDKDPRQKLLVRTTSDGVYVAAVTSDTAAAGFEIGIAPGVQTDLMNAGRFHVTVDTAGTLTTNYYEGGVQRPWICPWTVKMGNGDGTKCIEVKIPMESLDGMATPIGGRRWRLNARFRSGESEGDDASLTVWGDADIKTLEHGALLVFQEPRR